MSNTSESYLGAQEHPKQELSRWYMKHAVLSLANAAAITSTVSGTASGSGNSPAIRLLAKSAVPAKA